MLPDFHLATTSDPSFISGGINITSFFRVIYEKVSPGGWGDFVDRVETWWNVYSVIAILFSLVFFVIFIYSKIRISQLIDLESEKIATEEALWATRHESRGTANARWDSIQQKVTQNSPESWKIAIIEADIMLDEILTNAGYVGQSLGEKLKSANPQSFTTVQDAWEAHKVRNEIAHTGSDFVLTQKSAQDTIVRFERVFQEFGVI